MTEVGLGKLEQEDFRTICKNEASNFTKWLAQPESVAVFREEVDGNLKVVWAKMNV